MTIYAPPAVTSISGTPTNAQAKTALTDLWWYCTSLLGADGDPVNARTALGAGATGKDLFTSTSAASARSIVGVPTFADTIVTASSAAVVTTALGLNNVKSYPIKTGKYYNNTIFNYNFSAATISSSYIYYIPYVQTETRSMAGISMCRVGTSSGNALFGIYSDSGGLPSTRIGTASVSVSGSGLAMITGTYTTSIPEGIYWLAMTVDASFYTRILLNAMNSNLGIEDPSSTPAANMGYYTSGASYALPSTVGALTNIITNMPLIWMKA